MRQESANETMERSPTTARHATLERRLTRGDSSARRPLGHNRRRDAVLSVSWPVSRRPTYEKMKRSQLPMNGALIKCRRSTLNLVILSLFIIHNQIAYSKAQQLQQQHAERLQLQHNHHRPDQWRNGQPPLHQQQQPQVNTTAAAAARLAAPSFINQAATSMAAGRAHPTREDSSQKLSTSSNQNIEMSRSQQQAANERPRFVVDQHRLTSEASQPLAVATSSAATVELESRMSPSPSDSLDSALDSSGVADQPDENGQPAEGDEAESGADGSGDEQPTDESSPSERRQDRPDESLGAFEGVQLRPSRQSQGSPLNGAESAQVGVAPTTFRTFAQPETTTPTITMTTTTMARANSATNPRMQLDGRRNPAADLPTRRPVPKLTSTEPMLTSAGSFDVSFGSDRMLIKPVDDDEARLLLTSSPSPLPVEQRQRVRPPNVDTSLMQQPTTQAPRFSASGQFQPAESIVHHQHEPPVDVRPPHSMSGFHERRFDPTVAGSVNIGEQSSHQGFAGQTPPRMVGVGQQFVSDEQPQHDMTIANICYTPFSLLMVILASILITLTVCLGACYLFKYLKRHQFDLVANSKHFDHKHLSTSSNGYSQDAGGLGAALSLSTQSNYLTPRSSLDLHRRGQAGGGVACPLHLFQPDEGCSKCLAQLHAGRLATTAAPGVSSYAFRNPYFADDLHQQQQQQQQRRDAASSSAGRDLNDPAKFPARAIGSPGMLEAASSTEQMHFIESHIADLHNRQVTSSVKELSSLGAEPAHMPQQVVDLTSEEQQARIRAHSKEGDLVAVDLTGHDIIGLGFDVCGNQRDGIFIRSVSSHGPARESGCIQAGDRIKCINVSFENMTIQDACDLLNASAPYKLRLLIEKKVATVSELSKIQQANDKPSLIASQPRRTMMMMQPNAFKLAPRETSRGPLEAGRVYLRRLTDRLTGRQADDWHEDMQQFRNDIQRQQQQRMMMMATANNPLLLMSQCKRMPMEYSEGASNQYKLAPIGSFSAAGRIDTTDRTESTGRASSRRSSQLTIDEQRHGRAEVTRTTPNHERDQTRHRRGESCHINGAFRSEKVDEQQVGGNNDGASGGGASRGKYLSGDTANDMEIAAGLHDKRGHNGSDADDLDAHHHEQEDADQLYDYERQSKLMASGETFNSKSRLTM